MTDLTYALASGDQIPEIEPLMSIREVCEWLGICDTTLRRLRRQKKLEPAIDDSGLVRYLPSDVRAYLSREKEAARQAFAQKQARRFPGAGLKSQDPEVAALPAPM
ncbi:MAG TPA: helix-turn-helix domain-containing protein [Geothrix sp.]